MLIPGAGHAQQRCEPPAARLVSLQGTVELQLAGTNVWTPATLGQALCLGDALRVGRASRAALALANDSTLRLDERTTLQLRGVAEEQRSLIDLILGGVYFFSHRPRALEVDTPFVNAAAEGTEFLVRVGAERAEVVMLDGRVLLRNPQGELRVASGDAALIPAGEAPRPMVVARPRDAVAWALYYPPILTALAGRGAVPPGLPPGLQAAVDAVAANDYAGALDALDAVPEAARDARYWTYRAGVLLNVGRVEEAEAAIERALALDPGGRRRARPAGGHPGGPEPPGGGARRCAARARAEPGFGRCRHRPVLRPAGRLPARGSAGGAARQRSSAARRTRSPGRVLPSSSRCSAIWVPPEMPPSRRSPSPPIWRARRWCSASRR